MLFIDSLNGAALNHCLCAIRLSTRRRVALYTVLPVSIGFVCCNPHTAGTSVVIGLGVRRQQGKGEMGEGASVLSIINQSLYSTSCHISVYHYPMPLTRYTRTYTWVDASMCICFSSVAAGGIEPPETPTASIVHHAAHFRVKLLQLLCIFLNGSFPGC